MTDPNAMANGRVNLIGEHTDYNGGWVLPTAIPQSTNVWLTRRADQRVHARTHLKGAAYENEKSFELGHETRGQGWIDYLQGATLLLKKAGHEIGGFDLKIDSTVPAGSGLSSSAALEISALKAIRDAFSLQMTDVEMALLAQKIEVEFVGANVGIMDQMACALAKFGEALYLDTKNLRYERLPLPVDAMDLVVINSGLEHQHAGGGYNDRRQECEDAKKALQVEHLCDLKTKDLGRLESLPDVLRRRSRHVITENERVHEAASALKALDLKKLGALFYESHRSMRDDYEISVPGIDLLVDLCRKNENTFGARMTGGGFGGSIVAITKKGTGFSVARSVADAYNAAGFAHATILVPEL